MCSNRKCLATVYVCDGDDDCGDGSDELKCASPLTCGPNHLRCNTSECVPLMWSCDGDPDCSDSSDEGPERCGGDGAPYLNNRRANCTAGEFRCANGECVRLTWKCDGDPDCKDKSDESDCREFAFCVRSSLICPCTAFLHEALCLPPFCVLQELIHVFNCNITFFCPLRSHWCMKFASLSDGGCGLIGYVTRLRESLGTIENWSAHVTMVTWWGYSRIHPIYHLHTNYILILCRLEVAVHAIPRESGGTI